MIFSKKRHKPFYKQFLRFKKNIQNRSKILKFKKLKWIRFQQYFKIQLKFHKRFKIKDQYQILILKFASKGNSFKKKFKNNLYFRKIFSLFYGKLKKQYVKFYFSKLINYSFIKQIDYRFMTLKFFESRLDVVLYRAGFTLSIRGSAQLILHSHVLVNKITIKIKSYILKPNDLIEITLLKKPRNLVKINLAKSNFWLVPPKHLIINFKTLQILFNYTILIQTPIFEHYLNINSITNNIRKC